MAKKKNKQQAPEMDWRAVPVSQRLVSSLAEEALALPRGHRVQAIARVLLERYRDAEPYHFDTPEVDDATDPFEGLTELIEAA